jgi:hypothetical protein
VFAGSCIGREVDVCVQWWNRMVGTENTTIRRLPPANPFPPLRHHVYSPASSFRGSRQEEANMVYEIAVPTPTHGVDMPLTSVTSSEWNAYSSHASRTSEVPTAPPLPASVADTLTRLA